MGTLILKVPTQREDWATPERLLAMRQGGMKIKDIAQAAHISPGRVSQLITRAKKSYQ